MMTQKQEHITDYLTLGKVLIALLFLTCVTILITAIDIAAWTVVVALVIASIKVFIVLSYFMHLKHESRFLKFLVGFVFLLFAAIIVITFLDYLYR